MKPMSFKGYGFYTLRSEESLHKALSQETFKNHWFYKGLVTLLVSVASCYARTVYFCTPRTVYFAHLTSGLWHPCMLSVPQSHGFFNPQGNRKNPGKSRKYPPKINLFPDMFWYPKTHLLVIHVRKTARLY